MNTNTMRFVDRFLGSPACHILALLTPLLVRKSTTKSIVLCKFFGLGSICLSIPLVRELRKLGYEITYLTFEANDPLAKMIGIERTICIAPTSAFGFLWGVMRAIWKLRQCRPAVFLNLEFFSRFAAIMTLFSGAPVRAGFHISHLPVGKLYSHHTNLNVYRPIFENYLNVGISAGVLDKLAPYTPVKADLKIAGPSASPPLVGGRYFVINAESSETIQLLRTWPVRSWSKLLDQLQTTYPDITLVLMGTKSSVALYARILADAQATDGVVNLAGETSFEQLVQIISDAEMMITVDSGPFHISTMLERKTVGLFGPETPVLYGYDLPWVRNIHKNLICSPCLALYDAKKSVLDCRDNQCMKQISVPEVMAEIVSLATSGTSDRVSAS